MHIERINGEKVCVCVEHKHVAALMRQKYAIMRHPESAIEGRGRKKR